MMEDLQLDRVPLLRPSPALQEAVVCVPLFPSQ